MFIPNGIKDNDRVRLTRPVHVFAGTYTKGHEFTVVSVGTRGPNLIDEDGNLVLEAGFVTSSMEIWRDNKWIPFEFIPVNY